MNYCPGQMMQATYSRNEQATRSDPRPCRDQRLCRREVPPGEGAGERTGALPTDAEQETCLEMPFIGSARMAACTVELEGDAQRLD
jgi:hypothetical protein